MSLTLADIDNMPSAEYKQRLLSDPKFIEEVEALFQGPNAPAVAARPVSAPPSEEIDPSIPDAPTTTGPKSTSVRDRIERPVDAPEPVAPAPVAAVPPPEPAPVAEAPELVYEYQPMDEHNRPLGGKQVIKYRTPDELARKLTEQNVLLVRKLRQVTRENRLGINKDEAPKSATRFTEIEFKEKPLSAEERFQLTQDLNDPEKFASARDRLLESAVGVSPAELRRTLNDQNMTLLQMRAKENFITFTQQNEFATGDLTTDTENTQTLTDWMFKNKLAPTVENYELAYSHLRSAGLLNEAPVVQQVPVPQPPAVVPVETVAPKAQEPVVVESRIAPVEPVQPKRHSPVPSGLNDRVSSASGVSPTTASSVTLADIDKMSADEFKKAAKNPAFVALVNRLETEAITRRRQRVV
jgi:hypothetical protein